MERVEMYIANGVFGGPLDRAEHAARIDCIFDGAVSASDRGVVHPNIPLWSSELFERGCWRLALHRKRVLISSCSRRHGCR